VHGQHHINAMYRYTPLTLVLLVLAIADVSAAHLLSLAVAVCSAILLPLAHSLHTSMHEFAAYLSHFLSLLLLVLPTAADAVPAQQ
jgi:hypothetical protein